MSEHALDLKLILRLKKQLAEEESVVYHLGRQATHAYEDASELRVITEEWRDEENIKRYVNRRILELEDATRGKFYGIAHSPSWKRPGVTRMLKEARTDPSKCAGVKQELCDRIEQVRRLQKIGRDQVQINADLKAFQDLKVIAAYMNRAPKWTRRKLLSFIGKAWPRRALAHLEFDYE